MRNKQYILPILMMGSLLQACQVSKPKEANLHLDTLPSQVITTTDTNSVAVVTYQNYFKDADLQNHIATVLAQNKDLLAASEMLLGTEALLKSAKLNYLPDVNLQLAPAVQRLSKNSMMGGFLENMVYQDYTLAPQLSWEIDLWGKLKNERKESQALYLAQQQVIRGVKLQLIAQTAEVYYNLVYLQEQVKAIEEIRTLLKQSATFLEHQYKYGDASIIAVKQAQDQVQETDRLLSELKQTIKAQEIILATLKGEYTISAVAQTTLSETAFDEAKDIAIPVSHLTNRPDVKQQEWELVAANARVGISKATLYPSIMLSAQGGLNSIRAENLFSIPASLFGNLAGGITQPLFNKRRNRSNYENAIHQREAKIATFQQSVIKAVGEVNASFNDLQALAEQKEVMQQRLTNLSQIIKEAKQLFQYQDVSSLEVLTMQQLYLQTTIAYYDVIRKDLSAHINMFKAIGGQ